MPFVTIKKGAPLSDLVGQLFRIEGPAGAQTREQATAALLRANPHLAGVTTIPEGTLIAVPDVSGVTATVQDDPAQAMHADVFATLTRVLQSTREDLLAGVKADVDDATQTQALAKSQARMVRADAAAKDTLAEAAKNAKLRIERSATSVTAINQTLDQAGKDLAALQQRLGSGSR